MGGMKGVTCCVEWSDRIIYILVLSSHRSAWSHMRCVAAQCVDNLEQTQLVTLWIVNDLLFSTSTVLVVSSNFKFYLNNQIVV